MSKTRCRIHGSDSDEKSAWFTLFAEEFFQPKIVQNSKSRTVLLSTFSQLSENISNILLRQLSAEILRAKEAASFGLYVLKRAML